MAESILENNSTRENNNNARSSPSSLRFSVLESCFVKVIISGITLVEKIIVVAEATYARTELKTQDSESSIRKMGLFDEPTAHHRFANHKRE